MSNPALGFGACPCGSAAFGWGTPAVADPVARHLLKQPDGTQGDAALIDVATGDLVLDADGNNVGWSSLAQKVYLALRTILGSSAVTSLGIEPVGGVISDDVDARNRRAVAAALEPLTSTNQIVLVAVTTERASQSALRIKTTWRATSSDVVQEAFV